MLHCSGWGEGIPFRSVKDCSQYFLPVERHRYRAGSPYDDSPVSFLSVVDNYRTPNPDFKGQFNILSNKASSYEKYGTKAPAESIT
jgi:hypothetical protein